MSWVRQHEKWLGRSPFGTADDLTDAELAFLDGALPTNNVVTKAAILDASKNLLLTAALLTSKNVGTPGTGVTAVETGDGNQHTTTLTVATTVPAIVGGTSLGVGNLIYTFPAGVIIVESAYISMAVQQTQGNITADTPELGLGTVIAVGAVSDLGTPATFEDIMVGQVMNDCDGAVEVNCLQPTAGSNFVILVAASHLVHLNLADAWAASGDTGAGLDGTVVLNWRLVV